MTSVKDHLRAKAAAGAVKPVSPVSPLVRATLAVADLKSEARAERDALHGILNKLDAGFWDWDIPTSRIWYSDYILTLAGYDPKDVTSAETFFKSGVHPDDAQELSSAIQSLVDGAVDGFRGEFRYRHKQGHWLWFESSGQSVVRSDTGVALRIFGQVTCIDDLKQQKADAAFLVDLVDAMHSTSDAKAIAQTAAQSLGEYLGADRINIGKYEDKSRTMIVDVEWVSSLSNSLLGRWPAAPEDWWYDEAKKERDIIVINDVDLSDAGKNSDFLAFHKRVRGIAFVRVPIVIDDDIRATIVVSQATPRNWQQREVSLIKEVADRLWETILRAQAEEEQAASQKLLRFALRAAKMSARRLNMETGEVLLSENFSNMLSDDVPEDLSTGDYVCRVHPEDMAQLLSCFEEGQTVDHGGGHRYIAADGSVRHIDAFIQFDDGNDHSPTTPRFASAILRNVTEKRHLEAEAEKVRLQLLKHSRLSAMGVMASTLAHELNQPLTVAANYLAMVENGFETRPDKVKLYAQRAAEKVLEAGSIIRNVRDYAADGAVSRRPEDLRHLVSMARSSVFDTPGQSHSTLVLNAVPEDLTVLVDARMVEHAIANILRNAVDALENRPDGRIDISARRAGEMIDLHIADNGPGMDDDVAVNLFSPFITTKEKGTGLGLPLCRTMVEANGGKISLIRHDDRGAVFSITLPCAEPAHPIQEG